METGHSHSDGAVSASRRSYLTGFALALVLTLIPFTLVAARTALPHSLVLAVIAIAAIAQVLVHLHYFLHLDASAGERWNLLAMLFTALILVILAGGTVWIMYNLHRHMAPF